MNINTISKRNLIFLYCLLLTIFSVFSEIGANGFYKNPVDELQTFFFYWGYLIAPYFISGLLLYGITKNIDRNTMWLYVFFSIVNIIILVARWITNDWLWWVFYWPSCAVVAVFVSLFLLFNRKRG